MTDPTPQPKRRPSDAETAAVLERAAGYIPPRARTNVYVVVLVLGAVLTLGWDLFDTWVTDEALGRVASALALLGGALGSAYRPTR